MESADLSELSFFYLCLQVFVRILLEQYAIIPICSLFCMADFSYLKYGG